jgi:hypothetical protein
MPQKRWAPSTRHRSTVLLDVAVLAKRYMTGSVLSMTIQSLKARLESAKRNDDVATFEQVLVVAIGADIGPLRMAALETAKEFAKLREEYNNNRLKPEVSEKNRLNVY